MNTICEPLTPTYTYVYTYMDANEDNYHRSGGV